MSKKKPISGTIYIKVDGKSYTLGGSLSYSINETVREAVTGLGGVAGYKETSHAPFVEGEFLTTSDFSVKELEDITNATVTVELANGTTIVLIEAWQSGELSVDAANGTCTVRFEGMRGKEI